MEKRLLLKAGTQVLGHASLATNPAIFRRYGSGRFAGAPRFSARQSLMSVFGLG